MLKKLISIWSKPTLEKIISDFSADVWNKLGKVKKSPPSLYNFREDVFSSELVAKLADFMAINPCNFRLFHAKNEATNGNDFEILLEIESDKFLLLPCQAKKIFPSEKYEQISHPDKKSKIEQIIKLIEYADKKNGIPIYLLYNYSDVDFNKNGYKKEDFGCTLIKADFLKDEYYDEIKQKMKAMSFIDIHSTVIPFIELLNFTSLLSKLKIKLKSSSIQLKSKSQLESDGLWIEINPSKNNEKQMRGNSDSIRNFMEKIHDAIDNTFRPKYRIAITKEDIQERNINYKSPK